MMLSVRRESGIEDVRRLFICSDEEETSTKNSTTSLLDMSRRDYSNLPWDLCNLIADKITFHPHLGKFAMACKEWSLAAMALTDHPSITLLLPYNDKTGTCRFITLGKTTKTYDLKLPELKDHWICGSSKGWLAMTDHSFNLLLFNPLTRQQIPLPKPSDLDPLMMSDFYDCLVNPQNILPCERHFYVRKLVMSDIPNLSSSENCLIAMIFSPHYCLAACRLGDESWTIISTRKNDICGFDDIIIHEGRIYAVEESVILIADYHGPGNITTRRIEVPSFELANDSFLDQVYVVMSSGKLLYIERYLVYYLKKKALWDPNPMELTLNFKVYMFEESGSFKEINDLGGEALFLGGSCSMSVPAKSGVFAPWCMPNCIYFLADTHDDEHKVEEWGYQWDNGIFSMEKDHIVERFDLNYSPLYWSSPALWLVQNM